MSWSGTVQPAPSRVARSAGSVTAIGASPAVYLSAWRICSVDSGISCVEGVDRRPAAGRLRRAHEAKPVVYGKVSVSLQDRRRAVHHGLDRRVAARGDDLEELGLVQVARRPLGHQQGRVALIDGCAGEQAVALVEDPVLVLEDVEVLVLEGVVVLVREVEALVRAGSAALGDDVELALVVAVEAGDATAQQVERQVAQVRSSPG